MKPVICSPQAINMPDNCDECTVTCEEFFEYQEQVSAALDGKQDKLTAGDHITITKDEETGETIIEAVGAFTKEELLSTLGYDEVIMEMTDHEGQQGKWKMLAQKLEDLVITLFDGVPTAEVVFEDQTTTAEVGDLITVTLVFPDVVSEVEAFNGDLTADTWQSLDESYPIDEIASVKFGEETFAISDMEIDPETGIGTLPLGTNTLSFDLNDDQLQAIMYDADVTGATLTLTIERAGGTYTGTATKTEETTNVYVTVGDYIVTVHAEDGTYTMASLGDVDPMPESMTITVTKFQ